MASKLKIPALGRTIKILVLLCAVTWVISGIFVVNADERAVLRVFGKITPQVVESGIHYHMP